MRAANELLEEDVPLSQPRVFGSNLNLLLPKLLDQPPKGLDVGPFDHRHEVRVAENFLHGESLHPLHSFKETALLSRGVKRSISSPPLLGA